jgi:putative modified peptide
MSTRFTTDVARALLQKLSTDDKFRAAFQADARAALKQLGHDTPAANRGVRGRDPVMHLENLRGGLASKEKIAAESERMLATFASGGEIESLAFHQFDFCAE